VTRDTPSDHMLANWLGRFAAEARADSFSEFQRHLDYLGMKFPACALLDGTEMLIAAVVAYCTLDGQECDSFVRQQRYRLCGSGLPHYCLTFNLGGRGVGRVLTDRKMSRVDFADLYDHPWHALETAGYWQAWISRLDGQPITGDEFEEIDTRVRDDLFVDYDESELAISVDFFDVKDSVLVSVTEPPADF
jgi:hypothetical protein